jgi:hypothetical protein
VLCHGGGETNEYHRQQRVFVDALEATGAVAEVVEAPGSHHFQVLLDFADPGTALGQATLRQMGLEPATASSSAAAAAAFNSDPPSDSASHKASDADDEEVWDCVWAYDGWLNIPELVEEKLRAQGVKATVRVASFDRPLADQLENARVLLPSMATCAAETFHAAPSLRLVMQPGVGCDTIDFAAAKQAKVPVAHVPDANAGATSEFAILQILALARRFDRSLDHFRLDRWTKDGAIPAAGLLLEGACAGIIGGGGRVGRRVAAACETMGMKVTKLLSSDPPQALAALLASSDVVSLHCPLKEETRGLIDAEALVRLWTAAGLLHVFCFFLHKETRHEGYVGLVQIIL